MESLIELNGPDIVWFNEGELKDFCQLMFLLLYEYSMYVQDFQFFSFLAYHNWTPDTAYRVQCYEIFVRFSKFFFSNTNKASPHQSICKALSFDSALSRSEISLSQPIFSVNRLLNFLLICSPIGPKRYQIKTIMDKLKCNCKK